MQCLLFLNFFVVIVFNFNLFVESGIYAGDGKPSNLDAFLGPFVAEMIQLQDGFTVATKSQREFKVHVKIRAIICDSPARAMIKGTTTRRTELECEFPPKMEEDLTHFRRKRLTTETGLVCLEDYPYTVSVRLHGKHWCGGAIVGKQWILTAAQCFDYVTKEEVSIRMGSVFRDFGGRILAVLDIRRHPDYKMDQYYPEHNLAMVKVNLPIVPNSRMQAVSLALADADLPPMFGETVVTGYGSVMTGQIREGENQELRRMIVREVPKSECRRIYGNDYQLQHDNLCLQSIVKGVALCAGDTGDPAVLFSGLNRAGTLYGIALFSGTEECAYKSKPGVFAKVAYSRLWIDKVLAEIPEAEHAPDSADSTENTIPIDNDIQD